MDFFTHQDNARRKVYWLLALLVLIILLLTSLSAVLVAGYLQVSYLPPGSDINYWQVVTQKESIEYAFISAAAVSGIILSGAIYSSVSLRSGGIAVAEKLGGIRIDNNNADEQGQVLLNIVEEMSIAAGIKVPAVFIIEDESINAFAAGYKSNEAAMGITRGALNLLNRDELAGVVAHEFSHILNGDMRFNLRLVSLLFGLVWLAHAGRLILESRAGRDNRAAQILALGFLLVVIGLIGQLATRIIQSAISRQREFLADASAVQFTRNPDGIGSALKKISQHSGKAEALKGEKFQTFDHMMIGSLRLGGLFDTHPDINERIRRITRRKRKPATA